VSTIGTGVIDCQVCVRANGKTSAHLKSVYKMSTVCSKSNASSKTWTPLPDVIAKRRRVVRWCGRACTGDALRVDRHSTIRPADSCSVSDLVEMFPLFD